MTTYDFIVVGAGPSGCVLASRIANSHSHPLVLLLEAGGSNDSIDNLPADKRFEVAFSADSPLNWNYKTAPQKQLSNQEIDYSRGKGLGGSTTINFCAWIVGSKEDYDEWGRVVQDESFSWRNTKRCLNRIEKLNPEIPNPSLQRFVYPNIADHGVSGAVKLSYGESWHPDVGSIFIAAEQSGLLLNQDINSGDPIGMGMGSVCISQGQRVTASSAYLQNLPPNLTIISDAQVACILFEGIQAYGVRTINGQSYLASKEVIISGGAINTPQIMMLSGIGPRDEVEKHGIPLVKELPMLGKNLQDHCFSPVGITLKENEEVSGDDHSQPQSPTPMGWFKLSSVLASPEFQSLPEQKRAFLNSPTVPSYEIATHTPPALLGYDVKPGVRFLGAISLLMNPQSSGSITLQSTDPRVAPHIDPKFLSHPYDRRVLIEGIRKTMCMLSAPVYRATTVERIGPENESDEAIWSHICQNTFSSWHMSCTARMGIDDKSACVDSSFRVFGVDRLRIVDMSVCPFVPNNHTQSTAYVVGELAAEKLIAEHDLDSRGTGVAFRL